MSNRQRKALATLIQLAQDAEDEARRALGLAVTQGQGAQRQLESLQQYREDYRERLHDERQKGIRAANYRNFTRFLATLEEAIVQQTKVVDQQQRAIEESTLHWQSKRRKRHAYEALAERQAQAQRLKEDRNEQRLMDEFAMQAHRRHMANRNET